MQVVPQQGESEGHPMSLSAFEQLGGRGTARKWRRSLTTLDGSEVITLGEWMERYQVVPGTEGKHESTIITGVKPLRSCCESTVHSTWRC
ncbi:hypothetical protein OEZ86_010168 [Tetradesmus obliquus]|nr:hypothetical protein OEZ86_010168 [Tetradesmus obliquus]